MGSNSRKRMLRRGKISRRPSLPTIHEKPHEELLAALELVELLRQKSKDRCHKGAVDEVGDVDEHDNHEDDDEPSSPPISALCLEFVGKLIDLSNLVSPDLEKQYSGPSSFTEVECPSSFAEVECDTWERSLLEIYPTRGNVEAIAELDVDKVLQDSIVVIRNKRSASSVETAQEQIPQITSNTRSRPLSDETNTYTGSNHHTYQESPQNIHTTQSSSSSRGQLIDSIEISPGISKFLRGADETTRAIESGFIERQECLCCSVPLVYVADAEYVLCPNCYVISPVLSSLSSSSLSPTCTTIMNSNKNRATLHCRPRPVSFWGSPAGGVGLGLLAGSLPRVS